MSCTIPFWPLHHVTTNWSSWLSEAAWVRPQNACTLCVAVPIFWGTFCPLSLDILRLAHNRLFKLQSDNGHYTYAKKKLSLYHHSPEISFRTNVSGCVRPSSNYSKICRKKILRQSIKLWKLAFPPLSYVWALPEVVYPPTRGLLYSISAILSVAIRWAELSRDAASPSREVEALLGARGVYCKEMNQ